MTRSHLYCRCILDTFHEGEGFQTSHGWPFRFSPTGYIIFCQLVSHRLPPWSHHRRKWLLYQRPWRVATEKQQERLRIWWAQSSTYAKVWQLSVECISLVCGISLDNTFTNGRANSLLDRANSLLSLNTYMRVCSLYIIPTVPVCWVCCRCYMYTCHCFI